MASNLGFNVTLVSDATAAFSKEFQGDIIPAERVHKVELANLNEEFADIKFTHEILKIIS